MANEIDPRPLNDEPQTDELLTVDEVADLLKVNPQTVRNRIDAGEVPVIRFGRRVRIQRSALGQLVGWKRPNGATMPRQPAARHEHPISTSALASVLDDIAVDFARLAAIVRGEQPPSSGRQSNG
jgi:excisionase family DNA binding protein